MIIRVFLILLFYCFFLVCVCVAECECPLHELIRWAFSEVASYCFVQPAQVFAEEVFIMHLVHWHQQSLY